MIPKPLQPHSKKVTHTKIKIEENKKYATFINNEKDIYYVVKVDKGLVNNQTAADYALVKPLTKQASNPLPPHGEVIIELKGIDVNHAIHQVFQTTDLWVKNNYQVGKTAALIVSSRYPRFDSQLRRAQEAYAKKYKAPLHLLTKNTEVEFHRVLSFGKISA